MNMVLSENASSESRNHKKSISTPSPEHVLPYPGLGRH